MSDAFLTIAIDRAGVGDGSLSPLVLSGRRRETLWTITDLQVPGRLKRRVYMPDAADVDGSEVIAVAMQQGLLSWGCRPNVADEQALQSAQAELYAAVEQFSFQTTITVGTGSPQVWACDEGDVAIPDGRNFANLRDANPIHVVTIPVYPIPGA